MRNAALWLSCQTDVRRKPDALADVQLLTIEQNFQYYTAYTQIKTRHSKIIFDLSKLCFLYLNRLFIVAKFKKFKIPIRCP